MESPRPKVVIISGGSKGLGQGIVASLLADGECVATFSRNKTPFVTECEEQYRERFAWSAVDASDDAALRTFVNQTVARFDRVDVLINNAAIAVDGVLGMMKESDIHRVVDVNITSMLCLTRACVRVMLAAGGGNIINISSIVGLRGYTGLATYSATKAAAIGVTNSLARELGSRGVRVNCIAPGFLETEMSHGLTDKQRAQIVRRTPLGRLGTTADVLGSVRFLMSSSSAFMTGQTMVIDGGLTC